MVIMVCLWLRSLVPLYVALLLELVLALVLELELVLEMLAQVQLVPTLLSMTLLFVLHQDLHAAEPVQHSATPIVSTKKSPSGPTLMPMPMPTPMPDPVTVMVMVMAMVMVLASKVVGWW
jgi:hypothetical protein